MGKSIPMDIFFLDQSLRLHGAEITTSAVVEPSLTDQPTRTSKVVELLDSDLSSGSFVVRTMTGDIYTCRCQSDRLINSILQHLQVALTAAA